MVIFFVLFSKHRTAYEMRISDRSSDVCSSDLILEYQELPELVVALAQGKVDVVPTMRSQAFGIMEALGERAEGLAVGETFFEDVMAIGLRENDSDWRDWVNWALQRLWADGTYQARSEEHTSELQSLMRISYAVFCLKKKKASTSGAIHK